MLRREVHAVGGAATRLQLTAKHRDLILVLLLEVRLGLLHGEHALPNKIQLLQLLAALMVICFILTEVRVKLVPDGIKELADAGARVVSGGRARHAAMRI